MVAIKYATFLSVGLFGLQACAGPLPGFGPSSRLNVARSDDNANPQLDFHQKRAVRRALDDAVELVPIREDDMTPPHLRKREDELSRLDLLDQVRMVYGGMSSAEQMYLANMTLYAPDPNHPLIMMERFDGLTESVDCGDPSSTVREIKLKFKHKEAMDYAIVAWDWVNQDADDCFYLIANHPGCNPDSQRKPYRIIDVEYDEKTFTTVLRHEPLAWDELAENFDIDLGRMVVPAGTQKRDLQTRGFWDLFPKIDFTKAVNFPINVGGPGQKQQIFKDPFHEFAMLTINCADCYVRGSIDFTGHIEVKGFKVKELWISAAPKDVEANVEIEFQIMAGIPKPGLALKQTLFEKGIPGLSIPLIFTLGPSFQYQVGLDAAIYGTASFAVGVNVKLPNEALLIGDLKDGDNSGAKGFEGTKVDPILHIHDLSLTAYAAVYAQPVLAFGIKILDRFGYEAALQLKAPWVGADLTVGYSKYGLCENDKKKIKTGIKSKAGANIELWFVAGMVSGPALIPGFNKKLWGVRFPFYDICYPFEIPGLENGIPTETKMATTLPLTGSITQYAPSQPTEDNIGSTITVTRTEGPKDVPAQPTPPSNAPGPGPKPIDDAQEESDGDVVVPEDPAPRPVTPIDDKDETVEEKPSTRVPTPTQPPVTPHPTTRAATRTTPCDKGKTRTTSSQPEVPTTRVPVPERRRRLIRRA